MSDSARDKIAIIMRSKNEKPYLDEALESLNRQNFSDFTLYAIDSGSHDGSQKILRQYTDHLVEITPDAYLPGPVLNMMIEQAKEPIIVLLNADAIPQTHTWLENMVQPLLENQADATFCRQIPRPDAHFLVRYDYERAFDPQKMRASFFSAAACSFRRSLWEQHHFYEKGFSEDIEWAQAVRTSGARILYLPGPRVEHSHNYTIGEIYHRGYIEGEAEWYIFKRAPSIIETSYWCLREIIRDLLYTFKKARVWLIPYHIIVRCSKHIGLYAGRRQGVKNDGKI